MGKRSNFARVERDFYPTPREAVLPLLPHLPDGEFIYYEPCVGDGALWRHLSALTVSYARGCDIELRGNLSEKLFHQMDALSLESSDLKGCDFIITNPPWDRKVLHPMIEKFSAFCPTWLLFDADWMHTKQSARYTPWLRKVVSVGRVKWIPDSKMTGKDNAAWYLFDQHFTGPTEFCGRVVEVQA